MNMKKEFEYAAIFSANDVKNDFIGCIASVMDECDGTTILAESQQGIDRIAEVLTIYESGKPELRLQIHEDAAEQYGIEAETTEALLNIAAIIRSNSDMKISFEESLKIVTDIAENYNISHK